ncbi:MAG: HAD family hydrolase [Thaumarchaeota archaeon]|nr:MAG: HAD family hydrolase [Nitrososphaerota archaeon]
MKLALAAFDMDGTILEEDSSWVALHRHFGTTRTGKRGLKLYTDGKIDYTEFMRRDIASWPKNLAIDEVDRILSKYRIRKEAPETVNRLKDLGAKVTLVTSGIDILAERVARDLGIESWVANGLETTSSGRLAGTGIGRVDPSRKDIAYLRLLRRLGIRRENTIAVGDTIYDLRFLKSARMGFYLTEKGKVPDDSLIPIGRLTDIFRHLEGKL